MIYQPQPKDGRAQRYKVLSCISGINGKHMAQAKNSLTNQSSITIGFVAKVGISPDKLHNNMDGSRL